MDKKVVNVTLPSPLTFREKMSFLGSLEIFSELEAEDLMKIAAISKQYGFENGKVLIHQGDVADKLHILHSGRLEAVSIIDGVSRRDRLYLPEQMFNDAWLINPGTHPSSIKARQDGIMIVISSSDFLQMLAQKGNRHIVDDMILSDEALEEFSKSPLARAKRRYRSINLVPGELVEFETKRSRWVLFAKLLFPTLGLLVVPTLIFIYLPQFFVNLSPTWVIGVSSLFGAVFGLIALFQWIDWANDYLIITNKRLVHYEFDLTKFSGRGQDTLMSQVQSVETVTPNLISTILQLGTARVTTAALSVLYFDYLRDPERVEEAINRIRQRQGSMSSGQIKANMRRSVEAYFEIPEMLQKLDEDPPPQPPVSQWSRIQKGWQKLPIFRYRTQEGDVITYRKHIFALFVETVWPLGIMLILILALLIMRLLQADELVGIVFVLMVLDGLWLVWQAEDWRNDTFQLTDTYVIDIDRRPFGFGESRKQARLDNIQNVEADRPNILATLLNFGFVEIETAGVDAKIIFENVANPEAIKGDVFRKREKFEKQLRDKNEARDRERYAIALDVFLQERELDRITRRTPDFDQAVDEIAEELLNSEKRDE